MPYISSSYPRHTDWGFNEIENLKSALRLRIAGGPLADERVRSIAAAIDTAAAKAERT